MTTLYFLCFAFGFNLSILNVSVSNVKSFLLIDCNRLCVK